VSRQHVRDSTRHVILGTQQFKPLEFANQINLSMDNAWGILRCLIDQCLKLPDGKYLLMKDPNKPMIRLYDVPDDTFASDAEDEEGDEDEDDIEEEDEEEVKKEIAEDKPEPKKTEDSTVSEEKKA
jgi:translation initiation factor 3 subunit D